MSALTRMGRACLRIWRGHLSVRLVAFVLSVALVTAAAVSGFLYSEEKDFLGQQVEGLGRELSGITAASLTDDLMFADVDYDVLTDLAKTIVDRQEVPVAYVIIEQGDRVVARYPKELGDDAQQLDVRKFMAPVLKPDGDVLGHCRIGISLASWRSKLQERVWKLFLYNVAAFGLVAFVLLALLRFMVGRPLHRLDLQAQRIGAGDLDQPVVLESADEFGRLAGTLEEMRRNLRDSYRSLASHNLQLRELDHLKDEFLANMSHEIRTPLNSILGCTELLAEASESDRGSYLDTLRRNTNYLLGLVNQVLDHSKLESGNLCLENEWVEVRPLVEDVLTCLGPKAEEAGISCAVKWRAGAPTRIRTDPLRLRQILMNVVGNAVKFTERGTVTVEVGLLRNADADRLEVLVTDTGIGISPEQQRRLFVPFAQGDGSMTRRYGGSGLGLVISQRLARMLGGDVAITSSSGAGTTVRVTVGGVPAGEIASPEVAAASATAAAVTPAAPPARLSGRVLLVDDAADNRKLLSVVLARAGLEVTTAENGEIACAAVQEAVAAGQPFDLVLMDIQMPVMDGRAATIRLRAEGHSVPIVALTAHATDRDRELCREAGFDDYAGKPISRSQLQELVRRHLHHDCTPR